MKIRVGCELFYLFPQPTPVLLVLNIHYTRASDVIRPDVIITDPSLPIGSYRDTFGNWCTRILAPSGRVRISSDGVVNDTGLPDVVASEAEQCSVQALPEEALMFLLGSRYCETDRLSETAWRLFRGSAGGMGPSAGYLRFRSSSHRVRLPPRESHEDGLGCLQRAEGGVSRLRASRNRAVPLHEHPGTILLGLLGGHRRCTATRTDGLRRLVRGVSRREVVHVRRTK